MSCKRMHIPGDIHLVTNRCFQSRLLMLPDDDINFIIGYWFARALEKYGKGLKIFAFIFLSNHLHILLKDMEGSLATFMCYFQSNIARAINRERGRRGAFWESHYDDKIIDGNSEFWSAYTYISSNAVKAGLVNKAEEWIGWGSYKHALNNEPFSFTAVNRNRYTKASRNRKQNPDPKLFEETYSFRLETPLGLESMSTQDKAAHIREMITKQDATFRELRKNKPPLGVDKIRSQNPLDQPETTERKPKQRFACDNPKKLEDRLEKFRNFIGSYASVHQQFKKNLKSKTHFHNEWPIGSYPPSRWRPFSAVGE